jgi:nucleoside-diphosphate-sugar epimerase
METPLSSTSARRVLVTGISGNLGRRIAPLLAGYDVLSVDLHPPPADISAGKFLQLDLSSRAGQNALAEIVEKECPEAILHLAFIIDPVRTGIVDEKRMWETNVAATQHLLEAVARANRDALRVRLFLFPSSVSAYGPDLPTQVRENAPLLAHTLPYAVHKREADAICQKMYPELGGCAVYIFRPHIYVGPTVDNYILRAIRGLPSGRGWLARACEKRARRLPLLLPSSSKGENLLQFVHIDDVARILLWTLKNFHSEELQILNLAGSGPPITFAECAQIAATRVLRLPSARLIAWLLKFLWASGLSGIPPQALPYFLGSYTMDTTRLQHALGPDYAQVIQFSTRDALRDALRR